MLATDHGIDCLNTLLRSEIAATEAYQKAISRVDGTSRAGGLRRIHIEHREAAIVLQQHIRKCGGTPGQCTEVCGKWGKLLDRLADPFDPMAALTALRDGEEQNVKDYEAALNDAGMAAECLTLIRSQLLPQTREHILCLDRMKTAK